MRGMNGEIVFKATEVELGRAVVPGETRRWRRLTMDVRLERVEGDKQTVLHTPAAGELDFAITFQAWNFSKANPDIIWSGRAAEELTGLEFAEGMNSAKWAALKDMVRYHLNAMRPACAHMEVPRAESYDNCKDIVCAEGSGYQYGRAWLVEPLPADFADTLADILTGVEARTLLDARND